MVSVGGDVGSSGVWSGPWPHPMFQATDGSWYQVEEWAFSQNEIYQYSIDHYYRWNGYSWILVGWQKRYPNGGTEPYQQL